MSVPLPSSKWCDKTPSSPSLGKTPTRKRGPKGGYGDTRSQPCAEFHGKRKALPSYAASHGCFDPKNNFGLLPYQTAFPDQAGRYIKRVPLSLPPDNPTSGIVGPEPDYSVRGRNLPIIFCKQIRHAAMHARMSHNPGHPVWKAILLLFCDPDRTLPGAERPNAGCHQTRRWTDIQVQTWTKLANWLGIRYSGQREYAFPKGSLGVVRHGSYHHNDRTLSSFPWPGKNGTQETELPKFRFERNRKRSGLSRVLRSIKRAKSIGVKPIPISEIIVSRKIIPSSKVYEAYTHDMPISSFKETIPTVLSLKYGPALQLSEIVMIALRKIYSHPNKFMPDKAWLVPQSTDLSYSLSAPKIMGQRAFKRTSTRLRPFFSADGNVYSLPYFTGNRHMFAEGNPQRAVLERNFPNVPTFKESEELFEKYSDMIDDYENDNRQVPGVLGSWFD